MPISRAEDFAWRQYNLRASPDKDLEAVTSLRLSESVWTTERTGLGWVMIKWEQENLMQGQQVVSPWGDLTDDISPIRKILCMFYVSQWKN